MQELTSLDGLVVDLDGVVWVGASAVPGSVAALEQLRGRVRVVFVTNDPRGSRADYVSQLRGLGIDTDEADVVTSSSALASLLAEERRGESAFVIGSPALRAEVAAAGLRLLDDDAARDAAVVVVGGHAGFDYGELRLAGQALRRGAALFATGRDAVFPMPDGPWPGTGAVLAAVETAGGKEATVIGKPEPLIFEHARSLLAECRHVAIVGDNLASDIAGGHRAGLTTILVLTGNANSADVDSAPVRPDVVLPDLAAVAAAVTG